MSASRLLATSIPVIALVFSIVATVLTFIFIVPEKKRSRLKTIGKFLHDTVNFKFLIVEKILQALYIFLTAFVVLVGFFALFYVQDTYYRTIWYGGYGLLIMILGPIAIRLVYEFLMMAILLVKNVIQINTKLKNQNEGESEDIFATPKIEISAQNDRFCPNCGEKVSGSFCSRCGTKIE